MPLSSRSLSQLTVLIRELTTLNADIGIASLQGQLSWFFNSTDVTSCLANHMATCDHIIADLMVRRFGGLHDRRF